jgi:hypothetical protein
VKIEKLPKHHKGIFCDGVLTMQSFNITKSLPPMFVNEQFDRIVEIGTAFGGLSLFIRKYLQFEGDIITYDIKDSPAEHPSYSHADFKTDPSVNATQQLEECNIDFRIKDIFHIENKLEIAKLLRSPGKCLIICDGGNKAEEIKAFAQYLKAGDIILGHDYYKDGRIDPNIWPECELTLNMIQSALKTAGVDYENKYTEKFVDSVLFVGIKK